MTGSWNPGAAVTILGGGERKGGDQGRYLEDPTKVKHFALRSWPRARMYTV
jgi:hypothetical protein